MSFAIGPDCTLCGACVPACPRGVIGMVGDRLEIRSLDCNDCGMCMIVCPERAVGPDPAWPRCWGRGCPLTSRRYEEWTCSEGRLRCADCNNALWRQQSTDEWVCIRCDEGAKVLCPKVRKATAFPQHELAGAEAGP